LGDFNREIGEAERGTETSNNFWSEKKTKGFSIQKEGDLPRPGAILIEGKKIARGGTDGLGKPPKTEPFKSLVLDLKVGREKKGQG